MSITSLSILIRRLATWKALAASGFAFAVAAYLFFATSLPFSIPTVTTLCGQAPPDTRFYTSSGSVDSFLTSCGDTGRAAYSNLQLADLLYPIISALFLTSALALVLARQTRPGSPVVALAYLPLAGSVFDYLENAAAWVALQSFPEPTSAADLLGLASVAKQLCTWAAWLLLTAFAARHLMLRLRSRAHATPSASHPSASGSMESLRP